jgi:hypothetical protein
LKISYRLTKIKTSANVQFCKSAADLLTTSIGAYFSKKFILRKHRRNKAVNKKATSFQPMKVFLLFHKPILPNFLMLINDLIGIVYILIVCRLAATIVTFFRHRGFTGCSYIIRNLYRENSAGTEKIYFTPTVIF